MKKIFKLASLFAVILFLQSCVVNTEMYLHQDKTVSMTMEVDSKELVTFLMREANSTENSKKQEDIQKILSKEWKDFLSLAKEDKRNFKMDSLDVESQKIMKKIFLKGLYNGENPYGFALKMDRINFKDLKKLPQKEKIEELADFDNWDGKTLVLDMNKILNITEEEEEKEEVKQEEANENFANITDKINIEYNGVYKFEKKIKSIKGKHPYLVKVDDYTLKLTLKMNDRKSKEKGDKYIIITTE